MPKRLRASAPALLLTAASLVACNAVTGVDDLVVDEGRGTTSGQGAGSGSTGSGGQGGAGGSGTTTTTGMPDPPPVTMVPAEGVNLSKISLYQGVERKLMDKGAAVSSSTPIVAGRDALIRVFFTLDGAYDKSPVTARLLLDDGGPPLEVVRTLTGGSKDATLSTTINFDIPKERMAAGLHYRVELLQPSTNSGGNNPKASFPASGSSALTVQSLGSSLKVKLIPIAYNADGSGRKPDTSATQKKAYTDAFYGFYPIPAIELSVHAPVGWDGAIDANGNGWGELLDAVAQLRQQENAPADVYYYGIFSPAGSANQFCSQGCVAGLGMLASAQDDYGHVAIGLGFSGAIATETAVHEIGHTHGRSHAPCGGAQGVDGQYPYSGASIGTWGYDLVKKKLFSPQSTTDMMGYCSPIWVSDYTFSALFKRIKLVNGAQIVYPAELYDRVYERVRIDMQGNATWLEPLQLHTPPSSEEVTVTVQTSEGLSQLTGQLYRYDHLEGGVLMWPRGEKLATGFDVDLGGRSIHLIR